MKNIKKTMSLLVALLMVVSIVPLAWADEVASDSSSDSILTIQGEAAVDVAVAGTEAGIEESAAVAVEAPAVEAETSAEVVAETTAETMTEESSVESVVSETTEVQSAEDAELEAEINAELTVDAGITPDSILYPVDVALDDLSVALTTDEAAKAEASVEVAEERLAETVEMVEAGDLEAAAEAQAEHEEALADAAGAVEAVETDGSAEAAADAVTEVAEVQDTVEGHYAKVSAVKLAILERQRARMSPEQIAHLEAVFGKIMDKALEMETKVKQKKANAKTHYKALAQVTDAEVDALEATADAEAGLTAGREARAEKSVQRADKSLIRAQARVKNAKGASAQEARKLLAEAEQEVAAARGVKATLNAKARAKSGRGSSDASGEVDITEEVSSGNGNRQIRERTTGRVVAEQPARTHSSGGNRR